MCYTPIFSTHSLMYSLVLSFDDCPPWVHSTTRWLIHTEVSETCFLPSSTQSAGRTPSVNRGAHTLERTPRSWERLRQANTVGRGEGITGGRREQVHSQRHASRKEAAWIWVWGRGEKYNSGEGEKARGKRGLLSCMKEFSSWSPRRT